LTFLNGAVIAEFYGSFDRPFEANHWLETEKAHIKIRIFFALFGLHSMSLDVHRFDTVETKIIKFTVHNYYVNRLDFFLRVIEGSEKILP
jgi:hypothetical protein